MGEWMTVGILLLPPGAGTRQLDLHALPRPTAQLTATVLDNKTKQYKLRTVAPYKYKKPHMREL